MFRKQAILTLMLGGSTWLLILAAAAAQSEQQKPAWRVEFEKGNSLGREGRNAEAVRCLEKALALATESRGTDHLDTALVQNNLACKYQSLGQYAKAEPLLLRSLQIRESKLGKDHLYVAYNLNNLGYGYWATGQYAKAEPLYQRSLRIKEAKLGQDHLDVALALANLAVLYRDMSQYAKAEPLYHRCLRIQEAKLGGEHLDVALTLNGLGLLYANRSEHAKAEPLYERSLHIREANLGKDHLSVAASLNNLGSLYQDMGQFAKAEPLYQRSLRIKEGKLGKEDPDVALTLNNLAGLYKEMGQYAKAEPLYQRSLHIREVKLGKNHPDVAISLNSLALLYSNMGQYAKAEPLYQRSLQIREALLGKDHPDVASSLNNLAVLYEDMGQYARAEPLYQLSLRIYESRLGTDSPHVATTLSNLALLYGRMGLYAKAEPLYQRSLSIREKRFGNDHPTVALILNNLGNLYHNMGQYAKAEQDYQRSLRIREIVFGKNHPDVALSLNNLAALYEDMGQYAKAEPLYHRSLGIREQKLGEDHPDVALSLNNLALLYEHMGQYAKAEPLYQRSLHIREAKLGKNHPVVAASLHNIGLMRAAREQWKESGQSLDRMRRLVRRHVAEVLPILSESEQLAFLQTQDRFRFHAALSLGLQRREDGDLRRLSAGWLLNGKAVAQQTLAERALLERDAADPQRRALVRQLQSFRQQRVALSLASPRPGQEETHRLQVQQLTKRQHDLEGRLARAGNRADAAGPWIELSSVRAALPADAVLVEIAFFQRLNFRPQGGEKQWQPARYAVWVIPPVSQGEVQLIDLGKADAIDAAVLALRQILARSPDAIRQQGEADSEKEAMKTLQSLSRLVLQPLLPHIGAYKHWILSPDGALWLAPWAALLLEDGSYAVEKHTLRYVISGRDLVSVAQPDKAPGGAAELFADPDYGDPPAGGVSDSRASLPSLDFPVASRLPGTAREAALVAPKLRQWTGKEPAVSIGALASEARVKATRRPRLLMLSTHGFFLAEQDLARKDQANRQNGGQRGALSARSRQLENPLLRCGLLLAGCNRHQQTREGEEDGVLTGLEVVGLDLRGTELVVLSACETGLGDVRNGEGVAGLRQAFQLAGARSVLASLWQISDSDTAQLMRTFFDQLAKGKGHATALREAQLSRIKARRSRYDAAHPFFWAAFTLTGR